MPLFMSHLFTQTFQFSLDLTEDQITFCDKFMCICISLWVTTGEMFIDIPFWSINMLIVCV